MKTLFLLGILMWIVPGCGTHFKQQSRQYDYALAEDRTYAQALRRATEMVSKIKLFSPTNTSYKVGSMRETNGDYIFTFEIIDAPDMFATIRVSSTNATFESRAAPLP